MNSTFALWSGYESYATFTSRSRARPAGSSLQSRSFLGVVCGKGPRRDEDAFEPSRFRLLKEFRRWSGRRWLEVASDVPFLALGASAANSTDTWGGGGALTSRRSSPTSTPQGGGEDERLTIVVPSLPAFFDDLYDQGHLGRRSDPLHATLDEREGGEFRAVMADPSRYGPAKAGVPADGGDLDDHDSVQRWLDDLNDRAGAELPADEEELAFELAAGMGSSSGRAGRRLVVTPKAERLTEAPLESWRDVPPASPRRRARLVLRARTVCLVDRSPGRGGARSARGALRLGERTRPRAGRGRLGRPSGRTWGRAPLNEHPDRRTEWVARDVDWILVTRCQ